MKTTRVALILLSTSLLSSVQVTAADHREAPMISPTHSHTNISDTETNSPTSPSKNIMLKGKKILQNAQPTPTLEGRQKIVGLKSSW